MAWRPSPIWCVRRCACGPIAFPSARCAAIHAGTGIGALRRLEQLIQEAVVTVPRALIAETIDLVAVLSGRGSARRLAELARVEGLGPDGDYQITPATSNPMEPA